MTLDKAIQRYSEIEKKHRQFALEYARVHAWDTAKDFQSSADEHKQLTEWLTELKQSREKHSHWIDNAGMFTCANCGGEAGVMTNYCADCGFRMDGDSP